MCELLPHDDCRARPVQNKIFDFGFDARIQIFAPNKRVTWNQWAFPDHAQLAEQVWLGTFELAHVFGVVGGHIHLFGQCGLDVGAVAGVAHGFEGVACFDVALGKDVIRGHQKARCGIGVTNAEVDVLAVGDHIVQRFVGAVLVRDQQGVVAEGAVDIAIDAIGLAPYDNAAVQAIVEIAGGRHTDRFGVRDYEQNSAISTNGRLHDEVITSLKV